MDIPRTPSLRLDGRRALVAGASSGLGFAAAAALAEAGAVVVMAARGTERLAEAAEAVRGAGGMVETMAMDITDIAATGAAVEAAGPFDILVNSAGLAIHSPAEETAAADYDAVMAVNVRGAYFLAQAVAKGMLAAGRAGSIISISSQMGHVGGVDRAVYCSSKHAVEGFTKSMAVEWGPKGIRVNTICPTFFRTPLTEQTFANPERVKWIEEKIKLGRIGRMEDIMGPILFLASDASALITGTALMVDGGWTAD